MSKTTKPSAPKNDIDDFIEICAGHYWDTLEREKEDIMLHLRAMRKKWFLPETKEPPCPLSKEQCPSQENQELKAIRKLLPSAPTAPPRTMTNKPKAIQAWAIIDTELSRTRWTYKGQNGKREGLLSIYDKKPTVPAGWRKIKKVIPVFLSPKDND